MKNTLKKGSYRKMLILAVTAIPGAQKVLILFFISLFHSLDSLGGYVNDVFIVMMLTYFTAISWSSILISDINKYPGQFHLRFYGQIIANSGTYCLALTPLILLLYIEGWILDPIGSIIYLFSYTFYQLWRHYLLSKHSYIQIFILDLILLVLFFIIVYVDSIYNIGLLGPIGFLFMLPSLYTYIIEKVPIILYPKFRNKFSLKFHQRALYSGVSGFATASPALFIAPFSYKVLPPEYTSVIGFFTNIVNIIYLFPRSYSLYNIPLLSKAYSEKDDLKEKYLAYKKSINKMLLLLILFFVVFLILYIYIIPESLLKTDDLPHIKSICLLMLFSGILTQFMLPISNLSVILRKEAVVTKINISVLIVFGLVYYLIYLLLDVNIMLILTYQVMLLLTVGVRFWFMEKAIVIK